MAQNQSADVESYTAGETLPAQAFVYLSGSNQVSLHATSTSLAFGVTEDESKQTGSAASIVRNGTAKVKCGAAVTAGDLVGPQTATGFAITLANTHTSAGLFGGTAVESGSTNSVIEVALNFR